MLGYLYFCPIFDDCESHLGGNTLDALERSVAILAQAILAQGGYFRIKQGIQGVLGTPFAPCGTQTSFEIYIFPISTMSSEDSSTSRSRRRAASTKFLHNKVQDLEAQPVQVHTKLDLVLGGLAMLMNKSPAVPAPYHSYHTPPHHIGHQPTTAAHHTTLPPLPRPSPFPIQHLPSQFTDIPPFPSFDEVTPTIDIAKFDDEVTPTIDMASFAEIIPTVYIEQYADHYVLECTELLNPSIDTALADIDLAGPGSCKENSDDADMLSLSKLSIGDKIYVKGLGAVVEKFETIDDVDLVLIRYDDTDLEQLDDGQIRVHCMIAPLVGLGGDERPLAAAYIDEEGFLDDEAEDTERHGNSIGGGSSPSPDSEDDTPSDPLVGLEERIQLFLHGKVSMDDV